MRLREDYTREGRNVGLSMEKAEAEAEAEAEGGQDGKMAKWQPKAMRGQ